MASGDTKTESYLRAAAEGTRADLPSDTCCNTKTQNLILGVANRIMDVEDEVEELKNNPDVVDIVDTYADLQAYDTSTLTDKDIIRVLEDSTHSNKSTYYRWNAPTNQFDYIGEAGGGVNVVQTIGTSTTDVMSQDATSKLVYPTPTSTGKIGIGANLTLPSSTNYSSVVIGNGSIATSNDNISIGTGSTSKGNNSIALGRGSRAEGGNAIAIGYNTYAYNGTQNIAIGQGSGSLSSASSYSVAIGNGARANQDHTVAIGAGASANTKGQFDIGTSGASGYNSTAYRLLTGLYDGSSDHDAATYGQMNTRLGGMTLVSISQTDYDNLSPKDPNTLYVITGA